MNLHTASGEDSLPRNLSEWKAQDVILDLQDNLCMTLDDAFGPNDGVSYSPDQPHGSSMILNVTSTKAPDGPPKRFRITVSELH